MRRTIAIILMIFLTITAFSNEKVKDEAEDYKKIRVKWAEFLTGVSADDDVNKVDIKTVILANERNAERFYEKLNKDKNKRYLLEGNEDMKNGIHIMASYDAVRNIAKGYASKGTRFYKNPEIKEQLIEGLDWLYDNAYHEGVPELGNWWQWEIGIPKAVNDILALMYDDIPEDKRIKYLKATEFFQPDARYNGAGATASYSSTPDKRKSTGGNRTDTAMISFLRGVLLQDRKHTVDALTAVTDIGEYVTQGDGFYKDGSFIQHENVAYNGTYAAVLFNGLGSILYLVKDTSFEITDERIDNIYEAIIDGYGYLFINGGINDSVSGRAISRDKSSDLERGRGTINSLAMLSEGASDSYREKIQSLIKTTIKSNNSYDIVEKSANKTIKNILEKIVKDKNIKIGETIGNKIFHSMDRAVSKNDKRGAVIISMHSSRIANFETMNGENIRGWFTGDGMTYIYGNDSETFTDFWPIVDQYHLPGVTNSLSKRGDRSGERRGIPTPKAWTGGAESENEAFAGMDMLSWNKALKMKKSYLLADDGAVLITASNLTGHDGEIHTTIDNRIIKNGKIYVNGKEINETTTIKSPKDIFINFTENYIDENIGYKIIDASEITIKFENRKGNWKSIGGTLEEEIEKKYVTIFINHGKNPREQKFTYMILPMFNQKEVENYDISKFDVVKSDENMHIIKNNINGTAYMNFWRDIPAKFENIKSYSTASVIMKENGDLLDLYLCDPTQLSKSVSIFELDGIYGVQNTSTEDVKIISDRNKTRIEINLRNNGATEHIKLKKLKI